MLRAMAEDADFHLAETNKAFVLIQYFGYLRRSPDDLPDTGFGGWQFWLDKLNQFGGDYHRAGVTTCDSHTIWCRRARRPCRASG